MIGARTRVWRPDLSVILDCDIGRECTIHAFVWIGNGVTIGDRCKVQAHAFIPTGVSIGNDVFIGPGVTFTNDKHPPSLDWALTVVADGAVIGAGAIILPGVSVGAKAVIGAGSVVIKDVPAGATVMGNPAR